MLRDVKPTTYATRRQSKTLRAAIFVRDGLACVYCGHGPKRGHGLVLDHVKPVSAGGENTPANLVTACRDCNALKAHIPLSCVPAVFRLHGRTLPAGVVARVRAAQRRKVSLDSGAALLRSVNR